jgi:uncharacterized protein (TIGR02145 family)
MANTKVYVGKEGAQELYRIIKALIPAVDQELNENSSNPISNSAVTNAFKKFGGYRKVNGIGADNHPDVQNPDPKVVYLVEDPNAPDPDHFYEWIWDVPTEGNPIWRCIGTTTMDLEDYYTKDESDAIFATKDDLPTIDEHYAPDSSNAQSGIGVTEAVAGKADVSTTLAGYGISDAYTKTQADALLADKADIISDGTENNLISLANDGNIKDSGIPSGTTAEGTSTLIITNTTVNNETTTTYGWGGWTSSSVVIPRSNKVTFGNIKYPYVKIGNLYWMTENLRNPIGNKNIDYWEYDNGSNPRKYGLVYRDTSIMKAVPDGSPTTEMAALLHDGWRIPTRGDFYNLGSGLSEYDGKALLSVEDGGTDTKGFNGRLSGDYREAGHVYSDAGFINVNSVLDLYTSEYYGLASQRYSFTIRTGGGSPRITYGNGIGGETYLYCCLRLCCNAN